MGIQGSLGRFLGFFLGFYTTFTNALYAFSGIEDISLAAAETANARRVIPQAAKRVLWRILIFSSLTMFLVGLVVPPTMIDFSSQRALLRLSLIFLLLWLASRLSRISSTPSP
jgi:amino acid permease